VLPRGSGICRGSHGGEKKFGQKGGKKEVLERGVEAGKVREGGNRSSPEDWTIQLGGEEVSGITNKSLEKEFLMIGDGGGGLGGGKR